MMKKADVIKALENGAEMITHVDSRYQHRTYLGKEAVNSRTVDSLNDQGYIVGKWEYNNGSLFRIVWTWHKPNPAAQALAEMTTLARNSVGYWRTQVGDRDTAPAWTVEELERWERIYSLIKQLPAK